MAKKKNYGLGTGLDALFSDAAPAVGGDDAAPAPLTLPSALLM